MEIRFAEPRDIPGMIELLKQVGEVHHVIRPDIFRAGAQKYNENALRWLIEEVERPIFVAVDGNTVLGYCFCIHRDLSKDSVLTDRQELYIDDLCVDETHRGQGIAKALYEHACDYARSRGCAFVTLNVWCGNEGARKFYEKMGMTPRSINMEAKLC